MPNLISSHQALLALNDRPCRVARVGWPWGSWVESIPSPVTDDFVMRLGSICLYKNDQPCPNLLWEPEFADHTLEDWYVLDEREREAVEA